MLDGMSDSIQRSRIKNLHSREVDRQSPTGLIIIIIIILFFYLFIFFVFFPTSTKPQALCWWAKKIIVLLLLLYWMRGADDAGDMCRWNCTGIWTPAQWASYRRRRVITAASLLELWRRQLPIPRRRCRSLAVATPHQHHALLNRTTTTSLLQVYTGHRRIKTLVIHFASSFTATFCSHKFTWSSAEWSRNNSPSVNLIIEQDSTVWFMVCMSPLLSSVHWGHVPSVKISNTTALSGAETV